VYNNGIQQLTRIVNKTEAIEANRESEKAMGDKHL
jgi:hypothetical protein